MTSRNSERTSEVLSDRGWKIEVDRSVDDDECCFPGVAPAEILRAWKTRLGFMMPRFVERFGDKAGRFDSAFLQCLVSEEHRSRSRVWFVLARSSLRRARHPSGG